MSLVSIVSLDRCLTGSSRRVVITVIVLVTVRCGAGLVGADAVVAMDWSCCVVWWLVICRLIGRWSVLL